MRSFDNSGVVERLDAEHSGDALQVFLHNQRYNFALERISRDDSVLEVGTGTGCFSKMLVEFGVAYSGIEFDAGACQTTRERLNGRGTLVQGDAQQLPFADGAFSVAICLEVLEHLPDYRKAVSEIHRCLRPGGRAIISVPYQKHGDDHPDNQFHIYEPGEAELRQALARLFETVETQYQFFGETPLMKLSRHLHLRRLTGTAKAYCDLTAGRPSALERVKIAPRSSGMNITLLLDARKGREGRG